MFSHGISRSRPKLHHVCLAASGMRRTKESIFTALKTCTVLGNIRHSAPNPMEKSSSSSYYRTTHYHSSPLQELLLSFCLSNINKSHDTSSTYLGTVLVLVCYQQRQYANAVASPGRRQRKASDGADSCKTTWRTMEKRGL